MKKSEYKIIHACMIALSHLPGKNNGMSGHGAAQYHEEMRQAIGLNTKAMLYLLDGDIETAQKFTNDLVALVFTILMREGLSITASMEALK